jgi:dipeptidyl aminopeptidase/acylaminoacyl peptidase
MALMALDLASGVLRRLSAGVPWDIEGADLAADGQLLALRINVDGDDELQLLDANSGNARPAVSLPAGSVGRLRFHAQAPELALQLAGARSPGQVYSLDTHTGRVEPWTLPRLHPALDSAALTEQQIVRWTSFDGRSISGLLNRPPARFTGRRPVLINIHGGPEAQAKVGFVGRNNHLLQDLGMAVLQPNVRGSSGYGKTFLGLDNGALREDSVKDIGALLDWIATQPDLDPQRVVVAGGSYGGYMSLAVATTYPERIAATIDVVGISNFVSFLENTESYRRDLRRVEYGDERDPVMRAALQRMSPLTHATRISRPLLVVQGKNDPRVPVTEAEQIVAQVRANGTTVWYLRADNEGHGFARKENADYQFYATVLFLRQVLGLGE